MKAFSALRLDVLRALLVFTFVRGELTGMNTRIGGIPNQGL